MQAPSGNKVFQSHPALRAKTSPPLDPPASFNCLWTLVQRHPMASRRNATQKRQHRLEDTNNSIITITLISESMKCVAMDLQIAAGAGSNRAAPLRSLLRDATATTSPTTTKNSIEAEIDPQMLTTPSINSLIPENTMLSASRAT